MYGAGVQPGTPRAPQPSSSMRYPSSGALRPTLPTTHSVASARTPAATSAGCHGGSPSPLHPPPNCNTRAGFTVGRVQPKHAPLSPPARAAPAPGRGAGARSARLPPSEAAPAPRLRRGGFGYVGARVKRACTPLGQTHAAACGREGKDADVTTLPWQRPATPRQVSLPRPLLEHSTPQFALAHLDETAHPPRHPHTHTRTHPRAHRAPRCCCWKGHSAAGSRGW